MHKTSPRRNPITAFLPTLLFEFLKKLHKTEAWCHFVGNRQKGESQSRCFKKTKHAKFSKNEHFLPPEHIRTCAYQGVRDVRFSEICRAFFSWNTRFEIRPFALLPTICYLTSLKWNYLLPTSYNFRLGLQVKCLQWSVLLPPETYFFFLFIITYTSTNYTKIKKEKIYIYIYIYVHI